MLSITAGLYSLFVVAWFCCYLQWRDSVWWLALLNAFAPLFFAPILIYLPLGIIAPSIAAWIGVVVPALIFLYFYGSLFWFNPSQPAETAGDTVTIMTFNIWWDSRSDQIAPVITQNGSIDVAALQELREHMALHLIDAWGAHYPYRLLQTGTGTPRLGIFSRYPLIPVETDHLAAFNFRIQAARVITPAGEFLLYNVHPRAINFREYIHEHKSVGGETADSIQMQLRHIEDLLTDIDSQDQPVVVVGDFNCTPQSTVYARLSSQLVDGHRAAGWGFGHTFPAHGKGIGGLPVPFSFMRVDMLFHSTELVTLHSRVGKRHGDSDHLPVITTLTWQTPQPETQGS